MALTERPFSVLCEGLDPLGVPAFDLFHQQEFDPDLHCAPPSQIHCQQPVNFLNRQRLDFSLGQAFQDRLAIYQYRVPVKVRAFDFDGHRSFLLVDLLSKIPGELVVCVDGIPVVPVHLLEPLLQAGVVFGPRHVNHPPIHRLPSGAERCCPRYRQTTDHPSES